MKRIAIAFIVLLVVVIVVWTGAWFYGSNLIRQNVLALADADGQTTPKLTCARLDVGGWPLWFDATCETPVVVSGDLTLTAAELKASAEAFDPFQVVAQATGPLTLDDAFTGSKERLEWANLEASARLTGWRIARISVVGDNFVFDNATGGDAVIAKAAHAEVHLLDAPELYDAAAHFAGLRGFARLDHLNAPGFDINDASSTFDATIDKLADDVRTYGDPDLLKRWQAAGGKLALTAFKGTDGAESFTVTGNLALDGSGRPTGQLNLNSKGLVERIQAMVPEQMRAVVLGSPAADGSYSQTVNLTNGVAFSGIIPLASVPSLF